MPAPATTITVLAATGCGSRKRPIASQLSPPTITSRKDRIEQRGEDRRAAEAVGEALRRRAPGQDRGRPGDAEAEHVAHVVAGVGQQRHGMADEAADDLQHHEAGIEGDPDGEGPAEACRRVIVAVAAVRMRGRVRHDRGRARDGHAARDRDSWTPCLAMAFPTGLPHFTRRVQIGSRDPRGEQVRPRVALRESRRRRRHHRGGTRGGRLQRPGSGGASRSCCNPVRRFAGRVVQAISIRIGRRTIPTVAGLNTSSKPHGGSVASAALLSIPPGAPLTCAARGRGSLRSSGPDRET